MRTPRAISVVTPAILVASLGSVAWSADWWQITIVDSTANVGEYSSMTVMPNGQPAISYFDLQNSDLKFAVRDGGWQTMIVDGQRGDVGEYSSLKVLPSGMPAVSYYDAGQADLRYAAFDGTRWQVTIVDGDGGGDAGAFGTGLAILPSGNPAISYRDHWNGTLKFARLDNGNWETELVDGNGNVGHHSSLTVQDGRPAISYLDYSNDRVLYTRFDGENWIASEANAPGGIHTSLVMLPSGQPALVHNASGGIQYVWFDGDDWQSTQVDSVSGWESWFGQASLAIQPSGHPAISYVRRQFPNPAQLIYATFDGSQWHTTPVDFAGGDYSSLLYLSAGQPAISYRRDNSLLFATLLRGGDTNCDGQIDALDIEPFLVALFEPSEYPGRYPDCDMTLADINGDGRVDALDIEPLLGLLFE